MCAAPRIDTLELELWHVWTVDIHQLFIGDGSRHTWQILIPKLALNCEYLRNAILAVSSMHVVVHALESSQSISPSYAFAALEYHNAACNTFQTFGDLDCTNSTLVLAFSILNIAFMLGLSYYQALNQVVGKDGIRVAENIAMLFDLLQTIGSVISSNIDEFSKTPVPLDRNFFSEPRRQGLDENTETALTRLRGIIDRARTSQGSPTVRDNFNSQAIGWLEKCFEFYTQDHKDIVLIWPMIYGHHLAAALRNDEDDVCRLMVLHWAVLLHQFGRPTRLTKTLGANLVDELSQSIPRKDRQWEESIRWVQQQVELP